MKKILFVCSEIFPLVKTGGLADFSYSLPVHLKKQGMDTVVLIPGYRSVLQQLSMMKRLQSVEIEDSPYKTDLLKSTVPGTRQVLWVVDTPELYDRAGGPYDDEEGAPWPDNAQRFCHFCKVAAKIAMGELEQSWQPDIVHCNDWQTGLISALLHGRSNRPATIMTIHNLAYQGNFPQSDFDELQLPPDWWHFEKLEFHDQVSFIKGGLVYSDLLTTVSPSYAADIVKPGGGHGLEGLLLHRQESLFGILNGVDYQTWSPAKDTHIKHHYTRTSIDGKTKNKLSFQAENKLAKGKSYLLIGFIARFANQKGIELLIDVIQRTQGEKIQWAILGNGDKNYEDQLMKLQQQYPESVSLSIGYSEGTAHQIEASADVFMMPSIYEPCGLNQMYSLKYGTVPIVSNTGGLSDTVVNATEETIANNTATGFNFPPGDADLLYEAVQLALKYFKNKKTWKAIQSNGMKQDFGWGKTAKNFIELYQSADQSIG